MSALARRHGGLVRSGRMALFTNHKQNLAVAARTLGLTHAESHTLRGEHQGIPVGVRLWSQRSDDSTNYYTTVDAGHPVPLRMSLSVTRQNALGRLFRSAFGAEGLPTGHPEFDTQFLVRSLDPRRAAVLLAEPTVRDAILGVLRARRNQLTVSDVSSSITVGSWYSDVEELRAMLNSTYSVADAVRNARSRVPLSDMERSAGEALQGAAAALGLPCDRAQLEVAGPRGRQHAAVRVVYHPAGNWTTEFEVRFPESLNVGLRLLPQGGFWSSVGEFFGTQDIEVGHPTFDAKFKVKGKPEDKVAELLAGDVAERILKLHAVAKQLVVGDEGVRAIAAGLMDDAPSLTRSLEVVDGLAGAISQRAWGGPTAPYR